MNKLTRWEIFFAMLAVGIMVGVAIAGIGYAVMNIVPHQIFTFDGVQYDCAFPAPDVMDCVQVDDPDVGFGREQ